MGDAALDRILDHLRNSGTAYFPQHGEVKSARVVSHTPKSDYYIYEIAIDFSDGSERVNAKVYRGKAVSQAAGETENLQFAHESAEHRKLEGIPRPVGDFAEVGGVVSTRVYGLPLQSIIMKVALLPNSGSGDVLEMSARRAGEWLQHFHKATAGMPTPLDGAAFLAEMEMLCTHAQKDGLPAESTSAILERAGNIFSKQRRPLRSSAVLGDFVPLNVLVTESGIGFCEFGGLSRQGASLLDVAGFLAAVEVLEKYPFCKRKMTALVQDAFVEGYGVTAQEQSLLDTLKMKILLQMFVQGRTVKETAERKKVMWTNVMKRFLQRAAERSSAQVA
jgi:hypothetical protein